MAEVKPRSSHCQIVDCQQFSSKCPNVTYHLLPKNIEKRRLWIRSIGKKNIRNLQSSRLLVCSLHFQESDFVSFKYGQEKERRHLVASAVPSKFPWSDNWIAELPEQLNGAAEQTKENMDGNSEIAQVAKLKIYRCQMCSFVSNNKNDYQSHLKNHSTVCHICHFKTAGVKRLLRHIQKNHKTEIRFKCSACTFGSDQRSLADSHVRTRIRKDPQHRRAKVIALRKGRKRKVVTDNSTEPQKKRNKKLAEVSEAIGNEPEEPDDTSVTPNEENDTVEMEIAPNQEGNGSLQIGMEERRLKEDDTVSSRQDDSDGMSVYVCKICLYWSMNRLGADVHAKKHVNKPIHCSVCFSCFAKLSGAATHMARTKTPRHTNGRVIFLTGLRRADLIAKTEAYQPGDAKIGFFTAEEPIVKALFPDREEFFREMLESSSLPISKRKKAIMLTRRKKKRGAVASTSNPAADKDSSESYRKVYACPHCEYWSCMCDHFLRHLEVHGIYKKRHRCSACDAVFSWYSKAKAHVVEMSKTSNDHEKAQVITTDEGSGAYVVKIQSSLIVGRKQGFLKDMKTLALDCSSDVEDALSNADGTPELEQESEFLEEPPEELQNRENSPTDSAVPEENNTTTWVNEADDMLSISPIQNEEDDMLKVDCVFHLTAGFGSGVCLESLSNQGSQRSVEELSEDESRLRSDLLQKSSSMLSNNVSLKDLLKTIAQSRKTLAELESKYNANFDSYTRAIAQHREMESVLKNAQDRLAELQNDFDSLSSITLQSELNVRSKQVELIKLQISKAPAEECDVLSSEISDLELKLLESKTEMEAVKGQMKDIEEHARKVQADLKDFDENQGGFVRDMHDSELRIQELKDIIKDANSNVEIVLSKRIDLMKSLTEIKYSLEIIRVNKILSRPDYTEVLMTELEGIAHQETQTDFRCSTTDAATTTATECLAITEQKTTDNSDNAVESALSAVNEESQPEMSASLTSRDGQDATEELSDKAVLASDMEVGVEVELEVEMQAERLESQPSASAESQAAENGDDEELVMEAVMDTPESSPRRLQASSQSASTEVRSASASEETHPEDNCGITETVPASEETKLGNREIPSGDSSASPCSSGNSGPKLAVKSGPPIIVMPVAPRKIDAQQDTASGGKSVPTTKCVPGLIPVPELNKTSNGQEKMNLTSEVTLTEIRQKLGHPIAVQSKEIIIRMAPLEDADCLRSDDELVEVIPPELALAKMSLPEISVIKSEAPSSSSSARKSGEKAPESNDLDDVIILSSTAIPSNRRKQDLHPQRQGSVAASFPSILRSNSALRVSAAAPMNNATFQSISQSSSGLTSQAGPSLSSPAATFGLIRAKGMNFYPTSVISVAGPPSVTLSSQVTSSPCYVVESPVNRAGSVSRAQVISQDSGNCSMLAGPRKTERAILVRSAMPSLESRPRLLRCYPPQTVIPRSNITLLEPESSHEEVPAVRLSPAISKPLPVLTVAPFAKDSPLTGPIRIIDSISSPPPRMQAPMFRHPMSNSINGFVNARYPGPNQANAFRFGPIRPPLNRNMRPF